jgi:hypothetical protein
LFIPRAFLAWQPTLRACARRRRLRTIIAPNLAGPVAAGGCAKQGDPMDIVARAKGMILSPREEWQVVAGESADTKSLLVGYAVPLAAIPAVAGFLAVLILTGGRGIVDALVSSIIGYILSLVGLYVIAKVIEMLAPKFGGSADEPTAMKLATYAFTASWVAGAAIIIPVIGWLVSLVGGLYSLYTFYIGTTPVARVPENQSLVFTIAVIVVAVVINIVIGLLVGLLRVF